MAPFSGFTERTALVIGDESLEKLAAARVCLFGLGGVGAACAVDLVRAGVGHFIACDFDEVGESNLNRLAFGFRRFLGVPKALAFKETAFDINPEVDIEPRPLFITGDNAAQIIPEECDFYVDCIDSLNPKANLIAALVRAEKPFISALGTAGRLDPSRLRVGSIWDTRGCPLARAVRHRLKRLGLDDRAAVPCVWSDEESSEPGGYAPPRADLPGRARRIQGSAPFVPQAAGHLMASYVARRLII